jgi:hypothetical protein
VHRLSGKNDHQRAEHRKGGKYEEGKLWIQRAVEFVAKLVF